MSSARYLSLLPCIFMLAFCAMSFAAPYAMAQDAKQGENYEDVPEKYVQEAQKVYRECTSNHTRKMYFDCMCYSMKFLDERLYRGPVPSQQTLEFDLRKECRDATEAAGYEYNECLKTTINMAPGTDPEKMCACYANRFAKLINYSAPTLQSRTISPYKTQAKIECTNPKLARKLYNTAGVR